MKRSEKFRLTTLPKRKMRGDKIKTFKIINRISNFTLLFLEVEIYSQFRYKKKRKSTYQLFFFFFFAIIFLKQIT